jgi:hypothetical protein
LKLEPQLSRLAPEPRMQEQVYVRRELSPYSVEAIMNDLWWSYLWSYLQVVLCQVVFLGILGWSVRVCALDARRRGKSPFLVSLLVFVSFPLGLLLWLLFRPEPLNDSGGGFRLEDHRVQ